MTAPRHFGPPELRQFDAWVVTKPIPGKNGDSDKPPFLLSNGSSRLEMAQGRANDRPCLTYAQARRIVTHHEQGMQWLGFTPRPDNPICGIDADSCRDPVTGQLSFSCPKGGGGIGFFMPALVAWLPTYWSISPSGRGLRAWAQGGLPDGHDNFASIGFEMYSQGQYLTETGQHLPGTPTHARPLPHRLSLLWRCASALNLAMRPQLPRHAELVQLWSAPGKSETDLTLANLLCRYGRITDARLLERLLLLSGAYRPRWEEPRAGGASTWLREEVVRPALQRPASPDDEPDPVARELARLKTQREARRLLSAEDAESISAPDFQDGASFISSDLQEPPWRIPSILQDQTRVLFAALYKSGKTTFLLNIIRALCDATPFLSSEKPIPSRVAYLNLEMSPAVMATWLRQLHLRRPSRLFIANSHGRPHWFLSPEKRAQLASTLKSKRIDVLIIDTWSRFFPGDENSNTESNAHLSLLDEFCHDAGIKNLILVHHMGRMATRKDGEGFSDGDEHGRGASALDGWADDRWLLVKEGETRFLRCHGRPTRDSEEWIPMDYEAEYRRLVLGSGTRDEARSRRLEDKELRYAQTVRMQVSETPGAGYNELESNCGFQKELFRRALQRAIREGWVRIERESDRSNAKHHYFVTGEGHGVPPALSGNQDLANYKNEKSSLVRDKGLVGSGQGMPPVPPDAPDSAPRGRERRSARGGAPTPKEGGTHGGGAVAARTSNNGPVPRVGARGGGGARRLRVSKRRVDRD